MHPIERLRYVARSSGAPQAVLVRETAAALGGARLRPGRARHGLPAGARPPPDVGAAVVAAARGSSPPSTTPTTRAGAAPTSWRTTPPPTSSPTPCPPTPPCACWAGPSWPARRWPGGATSRCSPSTPSTRGRASCAGCATPGSTPPTCRCPASARRCAAADLVLLEASATGPDAFVAVAGSRAAAAVARHAGVPVWVVVGVGRRLPPAAVRRPRRPPRRRARRRAVGGRRRGRARRPRRPGVRPVGPDRAGRRLRHRRLPGRRRAPAGRPPAVVPVCEGDLLGNATHGEAPRPDPDDPRGGRRFLHGRRVMNVATYNHDGTIHLVAMWYGFTADGRPAFGTFRSRRRSGTSGATTASPSSSRPATLRGAQGRRAGRHAPRSPRTRTSLMPIARQRRRAVHGRA